ncbi:MAG: MerR family transcriptional regulator [Pseudonocardiales bacterium]|nr:MAG: MerR family transcriptional regulator [Pseudonocardiales bacterium]
MAASLSIGDFSRMTYLSIKALRHYHDVGLLEPASVDPSTGYRSYETNQVGTAQAIRRFRDLGMPIEDVRTILRAPDLDSRNQAITAHLQRMEKQLGDTQQTVASLRGLLQGSGTALQVRQRSEPATPSLAIVERVATTDAVAWWMTAFTELHAAVRSTGAQRTGPDGTLFPNEYFELDDAELVAFVPVTGPPARRGRVVDYDVPAAELAVTLHTGPFGDLDRTYGALGSWVAQRAVGADGPIRERYLPLGDEDDLLTHHTEVCWPIGDQFAG